MGGLITVRYRAEALVEDLIIIEFNHYFAPTLPFLILQRVNLFVLLMLDWACFECWAETIEKLLSLSYSWLVTKLSEVQQFPSVFGHSLLSQLLQLLPVEIACHCLILPRQAHSTDAVIIQIPLELEIATGFKRSNLL